ncbi:RHS repeat-associated core domain-containing protein [Rhizomonospora bruguierae]|uniref:RHS repeat-associated core domain-containing protein n=1 Tax=Rhizomonospora bruguierae TaxID=1581705 RepID=UPI001BCF6B5A|nr:RHS repeat-associated core domain-containing protein [Micromonospora sp. NBRC 107566]
MDAPRTRWTVGLIVTLALVVGELVVIPAAQRPAAAAPVPVNQEASVPARALPEARPAADPENGAPAALPAAAWPAAASADVALTADDPVRAGRSPLTLTRAHRSAPERVHVDVLDRSAAERSGGVGMAFRVSSGPVRVDIDYSGFRYAAGGNFADRLRLVRVDGDGSRVPVAATNDLATGHLSAEVTGGDLYTLVAAASGTGTGTGDYRATDLNPSGTWRVSAQSGSFTDSYPLVLPPSVGGEALDLALSYDSGSVDGRTSATNNQASWVGLGWDLGLGFIERRYNSCVDDGDPYHADLCWSSPYAADEGGAAYVISLDGITSELIRTPDGTYRMRDDQGWKIEHLYSGPNDDNTGEYWMVSTPDGDRHTFGYRGDSNFTVPVVGDDAGEPCHGTAPKPCRQTWRWGLDKIVDANENVTSVYWTKEINSYTQANGGSTYAYDRAGYLDRVEYGGVDGEHPAAQVDFTATPRCTQRVTNPATACPAVSAANASSYPDVPTDLICTGGTCKQNSPAFFLTSRLESIYTRVWDAGTQKWQDVARWTPTFAFPAPPDGTTASLWLDSIQQAGLWGNEPVTLPPVAYDGQFLMNRVDWSETAQQLQMRRLTVVRNGMGGETRVTYGHGSPAVTCPNGASTSWADGVQWDQNPYECFRVRFRPTGSTTEVKGVFHKYVVTKVDDVDLIGGSPTMTTAYAYGVNQLAPRPAWHRDDDLLTPAAKQDWTEWRGYDTVRTTEGTGGADRQTITDTRFFRGMNGDLLGSGDAKTVTVVDYAGKTWPDNPQLAGRVLQTQSYRRNGDGTLTELESQRNTYWDSGLIADGPGSHDVRMVRPEYTYSRDRRGDGTWRETSERLDGYTVANGGLATREVDFGETGVDDSTCTQTTYAQNTSGGNWFLVTVESTETHSGDPDPASTRCPGPIVERTVELYDGSPGPGSGVNVPTDGNVTEERTYTSANTYSTVRRTYDKYGRQTGETTANGTWSTAYSPATGFPGQISQTDPVGLTVKMVPSRAFDEVIEATTDANGNVTTTTYDGLGRLRKVWLPTEPTNGPPSSEFTYRITFTGTGQPTKPTVVTGRQLRAMSGATGTTVPSYTYLDGFGRTREVQAPSPGPSGGRMVTVTRYDDRGLTLGVSAPLWNSTAPGDDPDKLLNPATSALPSWTEKQYDALENEAVSTLYGLGAAVARTTTTTFGNGAVVTPPVGTPTGTWNDGHDRVAVIQRDLPPGATMPQPGAPTTRYTYVPGSDDQIATVTDPAGNVSRYTYDWDGHRLTTQDPNAGSSVQTYDESGQLKTITDPKGQKLTYTYDPLGRRRAVWLGAEQSGTRLAEWAYDTVPGGKGELAASTRYVGGDAYTVRVTGYDRQNRATGRQWVIPAVETGLAGTYTFGYAYDRAGNLTDITYPAAGGLPAETVHQNYSDTGVPTTLGSELASYVSATAYTGTGRPDTRSLGAAGTVRRTFGYEPDGAQRLAELTTTTGAGTSAASTVQHDVYSYDAADNVRRILDTTVDQSQCFDYDPLQRLSASWTTGADDCSGGVAAADGRGPDPFKQQYTYDSIGNLTSVTTGATSRAYTYPASGPDSVRPHAVTAIGADRYTYDASGVLTSRTVAGVASTYGYDPLDKLVSADTGGATTSFGYDADGNRLIRRDPTGRTLYLDDMEVRAGATTTAVRYYSTADGDLVGERTPAGVTWLFTDPQGSVQLAVDDAATAPTAGRETTTARVAADAVARQRYLPYGERRGGRDDITVTERGFLGKTEDPTTNLVALDNRMVDPAIGRLISPDPLLDTADPATQNAYAYGNDDPANVVDPSGLMGCQPGECPSRAGGLARIAYSTKNKKKRRYYLGLARASERREARVYRRTRRNSDRIQVCWATKRGCRKGDPRKPVYGSAKPGKKKSIWRRVKSGSLTVVNSRAWQGVRAGLGYCGLVVKACSAASAGMAGVEVGVYLANGKRAEAVRAGVEIATSFLGKGSERLINRADKLVVNAVRDRAAVRAMGHPATSVFVHDAARIRWNAERVGLITHSADQAVAVGGSTGSAINAFGPSH